jgi:hypothetical protein
MGVKLCRLYISSHDTDFRATVSFQFCTTWTSSSEQITSTLKHLEASNRTFATFATSLTVWRSSLYRLEDYSCQKKAGNAIGSFFWTQEGASKWVLVHHDLQNNMKTSCHIIFDKYAYWTLKYHVHIYASTCNWNVFYNYCLSYYNHC